MAPLQRLQVCVGHIIPQGVKGDNGGFHDITLLRRDCEFDDVHTFHFQSAGGKCFPYEAGMYVHLISPGAETMKERVRHMSFASAPGDDVFSFSLDLASGTSFKQAMSKMQPGSSCQIFKTKFKHFAPAWPASSRPEVVFLGGGIGMTAIRSLIREHGARIDWSLVQVARQGKYLYDEEFGVFNAKQVRTDHAGAAIAVADMVARKPKAWYYMCGSERFMQGMHAVLSQTGVPDDRIRAESFN